MIGLHIDAGNWLTAERLTSTAHSVFSGSVGVEEAQGRAALLLGGQVKVQAYALAYADAYLAVALIAAFACILCAFLKPMKIYFDGSPPNGAS
jgi:hypothetical protein